MYDLSHLARKPTKNEVLQMEQENHLEAMKSLHAATMALILHTGISPKQLVELTHQDFKIQRLNQEIIEAENEWIRQHSGKRLVFTKHPFKRLWNKLWTKIRGEK